MKKDIKVTIKLFSGINSEMNLTAFDKAKGITMSIDSRKRLRTVLKDLGLKDLSSNVYFCRGERISLWKRLDDGDEISCLKPSGGG